MTRMFRRMKDELDRLFPSDADVRVRGGRRRSSRRFSPSLSVAGLEDRLSLSGMGGEVSMGCPDLTTAVTNEELPQASGGEVSMGGPGMTITVTNEELPQIILTGTDKYPSY
jgi:hypothetical protein